MIIGLLILIAAAIRLKTNFSADLIPGINGGYYPLLARNILETGSMNYPDAPLVHWLCAGLSAIIQAVTGLSIDNSIISSARLIDSLIPPLVAVPVYLVSRNMYPDMEKPDASRYIFPAFTALYLASLMVLSGDMTKNSIGLVFLSAFLLNAIRFLQHRKAKFILLSVIFLMLTGFTHIGCLAVAFTFIILSGLVSLIRSAQKKILRNLSFLLLTIVLFVTVSLLLLRSDPDRLTRVTSFYLNPLRIFETPYLFLLINGQHPYSGFLWHNFLIINFLSLSGLIILIKYRSRMRVQEQVPVWGLSMLSLALSSPLIGIEWALRYHLMAWLPIAFQYVFILRILSGGWQKRATLGVFGALVLLSATAGITGKRLPSITRESYQDLRNITSLQKIGKNDLVVARHGLEWWTGWVINCRTGKEYCLVPADWDKYPQIFLLRQKKGNNYPGHQGSGQFAEFPVPPGSAMEYSSDFYDLYRVKAPSAEGFYQGDLPLVQGNIRTIGTSQILVESEGYLQRISLSPGIQFPDLPADSIGQGKRADIWGQRVPFSLRIKADIIRIYR